MKSKTNILLETVEFLKKNHLNIESLDESILQTVMSSDILSEQEETQPTEDYYEEEEVRGEPFSKEELAALKLLHKNHTQKELEELSSTTPSPRFHKKFWDIMKLLGYTPSRMTPEGMAHNTKIGNFAKLASDNWTPQGDYETITNPIRTPLKWYMGTAEETGTQVEYKEGDVEVLAYDEDEAEQRMVDDFFDWGGETETVDWGDYETHDRDITNLTLKGLEESIRNALREETDLRTKALISIGGIQRDKVTTPKFIKNIFKSSGHEAKSAGIPEGQTDYDTFYTPGTTIDLHNDLQRIRDRIRFEEYGEMFQQGIEGRGFAFEGMLAGLFNGEPMEAGGKEDIKVGNDYYSIKQSNPGDAWDTGSLMKGYAFAVENMIKDGFSEEEIPPTPIDLMVGGGEYIPYKAQMLTESFKSSNGQPLKWIFAHVLNDKQIEYEVLDSGELISAILSSDCSQGTRSQLCAVGRSRKGDTGIRIKSRFVLGDPKMITFPTVSEEEIRSIIYDPEGDRVEDKIRRLFKDPNKVSQYTVEYIKNNPKEFQDAVNTILPDLTMEEKKIAYNLLLEETDVFGQGLMDPIKPEEFEGTDEEWEKIVQDVEVDDDLELDDYTYEGGKTDPEKGFVAPSKEVTENICKVKGFCKAQGPITFGQLKELVEAATNKRIQADMGRGAFKTLWRIIPFFVPQILLPAIGVTITRAFNKLVTPALKDTRGYKEWWGKVVLKAMDIAEGDYIPDLAMGDDPISKVFFISDGLLQMIKDKYKLKFARYVADVAASQPDDQPVPDWFVDNLLRDYLNQKFLLDPPLPVKRQDWHGDELEGVDLVESSFPLKPQEQKKIGLTTQIFNTLDDEFSIHPHPEGDIENVEEPVALYSHSLEMFVPMQHMFTPINNMIEGGIPQEDIEMFVDIITDWLNQRINVKTTNHLNEDSHNPFGLKQGDWKDELLRHEKNLSDNELKYKKLADNFDGKEVTIPVDIHDGAEPVIGTTDITFTIVRPFIFQGLRGDFFDNMRPSEDYKDDPKRPTVIKYDLVFRGVEPGSILEELLDENSLEGMHIHDISARERLIELLEEQSYNINNVLMKNYFKLYGATIGRLGNIYDYQKLGDLKEQIHRRDNWQEDKRFSKETHEDTKLNVSPELLWEYLDTTHRERLRKEITPNLDCIVYNCYGGWKNDPDNEWDEDEMDFDEQAQEHCTDCGDWLNAELERLDQDLVKLGFVQEPEGNQKTWLEKPFPYSYNVWIDGVVKEINPRFYVDVDDNISYVEDRMVNQTLFEDKQSRLNPDLMIGDEITVVNVDKSYGTLNTPELFKNYVVTGIKHRQPENWEGPNADTKYYEINPIGETQEQRLGRMLAGGGMIRREQLHPTDSWVLRKGFLRGEHLTEDKMDEVPLSQIIGDNKGNEDFMEILNRFPEDLQRELLDERPDPEEFIKEFKNYYLNSPEPIEIYLGDELNKDHTIDTMSRTPEDVVDVINDEWDTDYESIEVYDPNPSRYFEYAKFPGSTAKPSLMVNDEILYGVARFVSALLRGDETIKVWDIVEKENLNEHNKPELSPYLEVNDVIRVIDVDGQHANMPDRFDLYKVIEVKQDNATQEFYYDIEPYPGIMLNRKVVADLAMNHPKAFKAAVVKTLYHGDTWIKVDTPMETGVDRKTISEQIETELNPELEVGDEIIVIDVGGTKEYMNQYTEETKPDKYIRYFVTKIYGNKELDIPLEDVPNHLFDTPEGPHYYGLNRPDVDVTDPDNPGVFDRSSTHKYLYPGIDTWMFNPKGPTMRYEDAFQPDHYLSDEEYEELYGDDGMDEYGGYLNEHTNPKLNPELEVGDTILVVNRSQAPAGVREPFPEHEPELFVSYTVTHKENTGHKAKHPYHYFLLPEEQFEIFINDPYDKEVDKHEKSLFPWIHDWILDKEELNEEALNDLVFRDEPKDKHKKRMSKDLGDLRGFPLDIYRNMPPPENESDTTEEEIKHLEEIPIDEKLVHSADEISDHFKKFLYAKGLEYPTDQLKEVMPGVRAIILRLKYYYNRPRPWQVAQAKGLKLDAETLQSASTPSYPSGHATQGRFIGRYLADLYPQYEDELRQIGEDIAFSRNMAKVHYPSDTSFGKELGDAMYEYVYSPSEELETQLDEYCPMGNPNRCEIVDYDTLPDTLNEGIIIDDSSHPYTKDQYLDFIDYAVDELDIEEPPVIKVEREATSDYTTGSYNKNTGEIKIKGNKRQLADVLRSIAHEMVHHRQNELGLIVGKIPAVGGKIEDDANLYAGRLVKSYGQQVPEIYTESTIQKVFKRRMNEALEPDWSIRRGRQHYAMNQPSGAGEPITELNNYLVKNSPFNYQGLDYYLSAVPGNMPNTAKIDIFIPQLDEGEDADKIWGPLKDSLDFTNIGNYPETKRYYEEYRKRLREVADEMEELKRLFSIDTLIINRNINQPWSRTPDSYGNENIRPGKQVPRGWPREELERV